MFDSDEVPQPTLTPAAYDRLRDTLTRRGTAAAIDELIAELRKIEDYQALFYALLMKKRVELGVSPFPTGNAHELPPHTHEPYEEAIRQAARQIGRLLLERKDFTKAWAFFRMLGEPEPLREALQAYTPGPEEDIYPLLEIVWQNGVLPEKGFDWVLERHGICSAITMVSSSDLSSNPALRDYCISRLAAALRDQLLERLRNDLTARGLPCPPEATIPQILDAHPELMADEAYHIDTSHLASVVQMSLQLPPGAGVNFARELCAYGRQLAPGLQGTNDPPFDENYDDFLAYLNVVAGENVEANLQRFAAKAEREAAEGATFAAQVYVNLLLKAQRPAEALAAAKRFLLAEDDRQLICPSVHELARRAGDYETMAQAAQARRDPVGFLASLIAGQAAASDHAPQPPQPPLGP
ncbi:MAG: hypothetical protein RMJ56_02805 [Gemmataceae bacterium]|nr:hypothetical protein [Gemmata sp.]MDW8196517.1 hypothetical protein [Gemmataceae bacterium]